MKNLSESELESAWERRVEQRLSAYRLFHGRTEGSGDLRRVAIESFKSLEGQVYAWVYTWENDREGGVSSDTLDLVSQFLEKKGVQSAVHLFRPARAVPENPSILFGQPPESIVVEEGPARFKIRFLETKHPGLFLDHAPLREWMMAHLDGKSVLNTFAYTGSLSVAAGYADAKKVVTLDLSRATVAWARENWELNFGSENIGPQGRADFIYGDVFEWLPRFEKKGICFDVLVLDPPSFSRSPDRTFSTQKDLPELHELAFRILEPKGLLVTSINSSQISEKSLLEKVEEGAKRAKKKFRKMRSLGAPEATFPGADHLKGFILQLC